MSVPKKIPLDLPPGVYKQGTLYQARGRWFDANGVRWHEGVMRPIGGWNAITDTAGSALTVDGVPRAAFAWHSETALSILAVGGTMADGSTGSLALYIDGTISDITPADLTPGLLNGDYVLGLYGSGAYSAGAYGIGGAAATLVPASTWQFDNFGGLLIATYTADGRLLQADPDAPDTAATVIAGAPTNNRAVVVTPEFFVVALGAGGDGRLVQWPDQASLTSWTESDESQAGQFPLATKGSLLCGRRTRRQTLLWTDVDVHAMTYIGAPYVYTFEQLGDNCGAIGPNAVAVMGDLAVWMGRAGFFTYDDALMSIPCDVENYVYDDLNTAQAAKITAVANTAFDEITWYYPSLADSADENTRYVTYNWREHHWSIGKVGRAAGVDQGVFRAPLLLDSSGNIFEHETGSDRGSLAPTAESGPVEIADGDNVMQVQRIMPDHNTEGAVSLSLLVARSPLDTERVLGPYSATANTPVRATGRQVRLKIAELNAENWVFGVPRLEVVLGGRR